MDNAIEEKLRRRIVQALSLVGVNPARDQKAAEMISEEVADLLHKYIQAPDSAKEAVYARGEAKLLRSIRANIEHTKQRETGW